MTRDQLDDEYERLVRRFAAGINLPADQVKTIGCDATTTAHRRWARWWLLYAAVTFTTGSVLDVVAYRRHGYPATLTCALRRLTGCEPARYGRVGQVAMGAFLTWAAVHLTTGTLGPTRGRELG